MNAFERIRAQHSIAAEQLQKSFVGENDIEKAKWNVGDVSPDGKFVWTEYAPGKFDWRVNKKGSKHEPANKEDHEKWKKQKPLVAEYKEKEEKVSNEVKNILSSVVGKAAWDIKVSPPYSISLNPKGNPRDTEIEIHFESNAIKSKEKLYVNLGAKNITLSSNADEHNIQKRNTVITLGAILADKNSCSKIQTLFSKFADERYEFDKNMRKIGVYE